MVAEPHETVGEGGVVDSAGGRREPAGSARRSWTSTPKCWFRMMASLGRFVGS